MVRLEERWGEKVLRSGLEGLRLFCSPDPNKEKLRLLCGTTVFLLFFLLLVVVCTSHTYLGMSCHVEEACAVSYVHTYLPR